MKDVTRRVLVVDDEPAILITLELAFEELGLELEKVDATETAIEALKRSAFDAVLSDKNLPGKSGIELVRWIRARNRTVPIVIMTGYASPESAKEALNLGIDSYLEKPFPNVMEVPELLNQLIESGRPGWLPGQADTPVAPAVTAAPKPARILLATSSSNGEALGEPIFRAAIPGSAVELRSSLEEILAAMSATSRPDLVILDADLFDGIVDVVEEIRERAPFVSIAVLTSKAPPLEMLQKLILLGVTQLLDRNSDVYEAQVTRVIRSLG